MDISVLVESVSHVGSAWRLAMGCSYFGKTTLHAIPDRIITDPSDVERTITAFSHDNWIEISYFEADGTTPIAEPDAGYWTLPRLNYLPGTPKNVNAELIMTPDSQMPLVWLMETMQEKISYDNTKEFPLTAFARIVFLDVADYTNYLSEDHLEAAIRPMRNYADRMIKTMQYNGKKFSDPIGEPVMVNHAHFALNLQQAKKIDLNSHQQNLFSDHVSGLELKMEIPCKLECC